MTQKNFCNNSGCNKSERKFKCTYCGLYVCGRCVLTFDKINYCPDCFQERVIGKVNNALTVLFNKTKEYAIEFITEFERQEKENIEKDRLKKINKVYIQSSPHTTEIKE